VIIPNWNLFLWILLITWILESIARIILGAIGEERPRKFGTTDIIMGIIDLILVILVFIF
jgi:hypothetical protein